jgi:hypothetical protein
VPRLAWRPAFSHARSKTRPRDLSDPAWVFGGPSGHRAGKPTLDPISPVHAAIAAALAEREAVIVSFAGVDTVTTSFVNAAFVPFLETIGFEAFKRRVRIVDATRPTIDLIKHRMNFEARRHAAA